MKTIKAVLLLFLIFESLNIYSLDFSFGLKSGLDFSTFKETQKTSSDINTNLVQNYKYIPGFQLGCFGNIQLNKSIAFSVEPGFILKGGKTESSIKYRLGYIDLPVLFNYSPIHKLNIEIGPEVGYNIYSKVEINNSPSIDNPIDEKFDLAGIIGVNYDVFEKINFGIRYSNSFIYRNTDLTFLDQNKNYMGTLSIHDFNRYFEVYLKYRLFKK
jgi:hypothetical protein